MPNARNVANRCVNFITIRESVIARFFPSLQLRFNYSSFETDICLTNRVVHAVRYFIELTFDWLFHHRAYLLRQLGQNSAPAQRF